MAASDAKPADPISDRLRWELAVLQRDWANARGGQCAMQVVSYEQALSKMQAKKQEADSLCKKADPTNFFNDLTFQCEAPPAGPQNGR